MSEIKHAAFRSFERARIQANDAMVALLVGARIARETLSLRDAHDGSLLPELFPNVAEVERLNRGVRDAQDIIENAELYLAYMAIPFVLAVYQSYLVQVIVLLQQDGADVSGKDPWNVHLKDLHSHLKMNGGVRLPEGEADLFQIARRVRNRLVHSAGVAGSNLLSDYRQLPSDRTDLWEGITGRPLMADEDGRLILGSDEMRAVLAITKRLARSINLALATSLSRPFWSRLVVQDYRVTSPRGWAQADVRLRRLVGFARTYYQPLELAEDEIKQALDSQ